MDLLSLAVPFFLAAIVIELIVDRVTGKGFIRFNDAIGSLATGAYNSTTGIFTKLIGIGIYGIVLEHFALWRMPESWFDASPAGLLTWFGVLLLWDFFYYWKHRLGHEMSIFWAAHSVHHQSEEYNLTTALRQTSSDFLIGWVVYIPMFLLGVPLHVFATVSAIDLIYQFWVHTRHVGSLGWLDTVFVTPSNHRVHHAQNARYIDKNYGGILIVWDRLFGTFEPESEPVVFGVRKPLRSFNPINANLHVYRSLAADSAATADRRDKIRVWFGRTGWRPTDVAAVAPLKLKPLAEFRKFAGQAGLRLKLYLGMQFLIGIALTLIVGGLAQSSSLLQVLPIAALLWWLLANLGSAADGANWSFRSEYCRLAVTPLVAIFAASNIEINVAPVVALAILYSVVSAAALSRVPADNPTELDDLHQATSAVD